MVECHSVESMASVLIVEDDLQIRELLAASLASDQHHVEVVTDGFSALEAIVGSAADVVILDLGLPDLDGVELLRMIRAVSNVPVVVATARDDDSELVRALDAGADEYVIKPFSGREMQARVRAILRRFETEGVLTVGDLVIDISARRARLAGDLLDLRRKEFDILTELARRVGQVVPRDELFAAVWRQPDAGADKTIDVHMSWLRQKLGETAADPRYVHTVRGVGYRLSPP